MFLVILHLFSFVQLDQVPHGLQGSANTIRPPLSSEWGSIYFSRNLEHIDYFDNKLTTVNLFQVFNFYDAYYTLLSKQDPSYILEKARTLKEVAISPSNSPFYRFAATNAIYRLKEDLTSKDYEISQSLSSMINEIKSNETNEILIQRYRAY